MGNLEKAGVLVVVALLAVILVVAFLNFPDQGANKAPMLGASLGRVAEDGGALRPPPRNVAPADPEVIRPHRDPSRSPTSDPPRILTPPAPPQRTPATDAKNDDARARTDEDAKDAEKPPPRTETPPPPRTPGYPKVVKVQKGETLWAIAVREYGPKVGPRMVGAIADANPKVRPEALKTGTELSLPAPEDGVVEPKPQQKPQPARKTDAPGDAGKSPTESTTKPPARKLPFVPAGN